MHIESRKTLRLRIHVLENYYLSLFEIRTTRESGRSTPSPAMPAYSIVRSMEVSGKGAASEWRPPPHHPSRTFGSSNVSNNNLWFSFSTNVLLFGYFYIFYFTFFPRRSRPQSFFSAAFALFKVQSLPLWINIILRCI